VVLCQLRDSKSTLLRFLLVRPLAMVFFFCVLLVPGALTAIATELANGTISLDLDVSPDGITTIASAKWATTGKPIFTDAGLAGDLSSWVPDSLLPGRDETFNPPVWSISQGDNLIIGKATLTLPSAVKVTWVSELAKQGSLFRLHVKYENARRKRLSVQWFPTWSASWTVPTSPDWIRWWDAMSYTG